MNVRCSRNILWPILMLLVVSVTACSTTNRLTLKVHTEPEGAHIVYQLDRSSWIYLGVTPLETIEVFDDSQIEGEHSFTLKAMRYGYLDQTKEWTGEKLLLENEEQGMIFWTPRLIKNIE
jgi:hypothetical protein